MRRARYTPTVRGRPDGRLATLAAAALTLASASAASVDGQVAPQSDSVRIDSEAPNLLGYPVFDTQRELTFAGLGIDLFAAWTLVLSATRPIPQTGLEPGSIALPFDRSVVGPFGPSADKASDVTLAAANLLPLVLVAATGDDHWRDLARTSLMYVETMMISDGLTQLGKRTFGRARPLAYLPEADRPESFAKDPPAPGTFHSMPSGHSSGAWAGASMAITDHLLRRPSASWAERVGVGLVGGAIASATSALRVQAGVHFPSDVVAGAGIGIVTGIVVPLTHRGESPLPSRAAWAQAFGGTLAGTLLGVVFARSY